MESVGRTGRWIYGSTGREGIGVRRVLVLIGIWVLGCGLGAGFLQSAAAQSEFQAGAALIDVTPPQLPVLVNGSMLSRSVDQVKTRLHARAIVLSRGTMRVALVVVDNCMMPRPLLDEAKRLAEQRTGIAAGRILISATHAHSAPSVMGCLGTDEDPQYVPFLRDKLVEAVSTAAAHLEPAQVGFASAQAPEFTAIRRWIRRPDRVAEDPFGNPTVRANMHAAANWDDVIGESGPVDPELSLIALQTAAGRPLAVLANFSMHYFGDQNLSADYFGLFAGRLEERLGAGGAAGRAPFVGIMSHGCSGDIWRRDYRRPEGQRLESQTIEEYAHGLAEIALKAYAGIRFRSDVDLAMAEKRMQLRYRVPDRQRLEWAERVVREMGDRKPKDSVEVYAREQLILHQRQSTEVVVQALRIGDIAVATTPNETYAITGLKIKAASPLEKTMVIELANGGDGYIPPPEQHLLGGYNTWAARSAGLEVQAEPKIAEAAIELLERVSGKARRPLGAGPGPAVRSLLESSPAAYWRLDEFAGPRALDSSGHHRDGFYEPGVVYYLEGPRPQAFSEAGRPNRAAHFAGGRLQARVDGLNDHYSLSVWIWNGMPVQGREVSGWIFSRGRNHGLAGQGDHLGLGGSSHPGRLIYFSGGDPAQIVAGRTEIPRWSWHHVLFVREGQKIRVYLDGDPRPEIESTVTGQPAAGLDTVFLGGRSDNQDNWEGRLDEAALFDRPLSAREAARLSLR